MAWQFKLESLGDSSDFAAPPRECGQLLSALGAGWLGKASAMLFSQLHMVSLFQHSSLNVFTELLGRFLRERVDTHKILEVWVLNSTQSFLLIFYCPKPVTGHKASPDSKGGK